jgi:hypothetical protein
MSDNTLNETVKVQSGNKIKKNSKVPSIGGSVLDLLVKSTVDVLIPTSLFRINFTSGKSIQEKKIELIKELAEAGFDPLIFDVLLSNEINRKLKINFGVTFIALTFIFTSASYTIIACNSIYKWNISQASITALVIQTPIQLIGILYIIARNLFPSKESKKGVSKFKKKKDKKQVLEN